MIRVIVSGGGTERWAFEFGTRNEKAYQDLIKVLDSGKGSFSQTSEDNGLVTTVYGRSVFGSIEGEFDPAEEEAQRRLREFGPLPGQDDHKGDGHEHERQDHEQMAREAEQADEPAPGMGDDGLTEDSHRPEHPEKE